MSLNFSASLPPRILAKRDRPSKDFAARNSNIDRRENHLPTLGRWLRHASALLRGTDAPNRTADRKTLSAAATAGRLKATLFACDPVIEYPSAIALGPRPGTLFVA